MIDTTDRDLRLSREVYRLRVLGTLLGAIAVGTVLFQRRAGGPVWAIFAGQVLVWPHLAWWLAHRSANPHRFERASLMVDSAFGGLWVALMHFNLLPSVLVVAFMSMDKLAWGPAFLARTTLSMAAAMALGTILTHGAFAPTTNMAVILASLPVMSAYPMAIAFSSYRSGKLARERNKAIEQSGALREQLAHIARVGTLGEMAAGLAHELNQPLTAMHLEAAAALELPAGEADGMRHALATISEQSLRAGEIVRRMRTFARRGESRREVIDLRPVVREVLALLGHELRLNGVTTTESLDEAPPVLVDRIEIQQVLVNLIRNAIEAMAHTAMRDRRLDIEMGTIGQRVRISVCDSGRGIDPDIASRLFHPFQSTKPAGLGLGLSICQSLIEAHGGRIGTTAGPASGAVFFFELPAAAAVETR